MLEFPTVVRFHPFTLSDIYKRKKFTECCDSCMYIWNLRQKFGALNSVYLTPYTGFKINARPLARGDWKPRGMSRIFAQVVRRAGGYLNLFCELCVTMNETNYWNLTRKSIKIITNCQNNLVLATVARTAKSCSVGHGYNTHLLTRVASHCHAILICLTWTFFVIMNLSSLIKYDGLSHTVLATVPWYLDFPGVVGNAVSPAATPPGPRHGVGNLPN